MGTIALPECVNLLSRNLHSPFQYSPLHASPPLHPLHHSAGPARGGGHDGAAPTRADANRRRSGHRSAGCRPGSERGPLCFGAPTFRRGGGRLAGDSEFRLALGRRVHSSAGSSSRSTDRPDAPDGHCGESAGIRLQPRLHEPRSAPDPFLLFSFALLGRDARSPRFQQSSTLVRGLGGRRRFLLPAYRFLVRTPGGGGRRAQGLHHDADWRHRTPARNRLALCRERHPAFLRRGRGLSRSRNARPARIRRRTGGGLGGHRNRSFDLLRRGRKVRPVPAPRVAAGRHGGTDPGQRAHPRRDDGRGRCFPCRPRLSALRGGRRRFSDDRANGRDLDRGDHRRVRRPRGGCPVRPQTHPRLFDHLAARRDDGGPRRGGLGGGGSPPRRPRLLQSPPLPRGRFGPLRQPPPAGHSRTGRFAAADAADFRHLRHRHDGSGGFPFPLFRFLDQGGGASRGPRMARFGDPLLPRSRRGLSDRFLHEPTSRLRLFRTMARG